MSLKLFARVWICGLFLGLTLSAPRAAHAQEAVSIPEPAAPDAAPALSAPTPSATATTQDAPNLAPPTLTEAPAAQTVSGAASGDIRSSDELPSPTQNLEAYEDGRKALMHEQSIPRWGFGFDVAWRAFANADWIAPSHRLVSDAERPHLKGILLKADYLLVRRAGLLGAGVEGGMYFAPSKGPFEGLMTGFWGVGPYVEYQFNYFQRQLVVPIARFQYEYFRYSYKFLGQKLKGQTFIPRIEIGAMIYLNFLEPLSAGTMQGNYGIKRTYLTGVYSIANAKSNSTYDLSERALRVGVSFEL